MVCFIFYSKISSETKKNLKFEYFIECRDENEPPQIPDISATKPDGWLDDEEEMVPDPSAVKPDDWYVAIISEIFTLRTKWNNIHVISKLKLFMN